MGLKERFKGGDLVDREIPGIGTIQIRKLTAADYIAMPDGSMYSVVAASVHEEGKLVFGGLQEVRELEGWVARKLTDAVSEVNHLDEDAKKNSSPTTGDSSPPK